MKKLKNILVASILTVSAFTATIMTSCNPDACKDVVCSNGGTCTDGSCTCASGYEGSDCNTQSLSKILGTNNTSANYNFSDAGSALCGGTYTGTFTATRSAADTTNLILTNMGGFGVTTYVKATVDKNTLTIPTQAITGVSPTVTVSGTGTYSNGVINGTYNSTDATGTCSYTFTWTKQ